MDLAGTKYVSQLGGVKISRLWSKVAPFGRSCPVCKHGLISGFFLEKWLFKLLCALFSAVKLFCCEIELKLKEL